MSDWGIINFYYDYEVRGGGKKENERVRGLVSKAYAYPGVDEMILHAFNGIRYFMERKDRGSRFRGECFDQWNGGMAELNQAFDTFFEYGHISIGSSNVAQVIFDTSVDNIGYRLTGCEGMYGWLFMSYTGNPKDGYTLKYGYEYGYVYEDEWNIVDIKKALDIYKDKHNLSSKDLYPQDMLDKVAEYFKDNAVLMSKEDIR